VFDSVDRRQRPEGEASRGAPRSVARAPLHEPIHRVVAVETTSRGAGVEEGWEGSAATGFPTRPPVPALMKMKCEAVQEPGCRRFHRPAGRRVGLGALLVGHFESDDSFCREGGHRISTRSCCELRARPRRPRCRHRRSRGPSAAACDVTGPPRDRRASRLPRMDRARQASSSSPAGVRQTRGRGTS
jgi:hypothetical protein